MQNQLMKLRGTRMQYVFLLHRNCFLLINMLEKFIKFENVQKFQNYKIKNKKIKGQYVLLNLKILKIS